MSRGEQHSQKLWAGAVGPPHSSAGGGGAGVAAGAEVSWEVATVGPCAAGEHDRQRADDRQEATLAC
jgi:hypothetical protein